MSLGTGLNVISYVEKLVGSSHPTLSDTLNRALLELIAKFDEGNADTQVTRNHIKIASATDITSGVVDDDIVYWDDVTSKWIKAVDKADGIIDVTNQIVYIFGITTFAGITTLTPGTEYYLDSTTPGAITTDSTSGVLIGRAFTTSSILNVLTGGGSGGVDINYLNNALFEAYIPYTATGGETQFNVTDNSNVQIYKNGTLLILGTDYTLNGDGINIDLVVALVASDFMQAYDLKKIAVLLATKQDTLVSGTNIKTINGESLLGSTDIVITSTLSGIRQTVQKASVDANGLPNYITAGTGLVVDVAATSVPVEIHAAGGSIANDRFGTISADTTISGLTDNATNYLFADVASDGTVTLSANTVQHIEQQGGTPAVTNNLLTFNYGAMEGYLGDGAVAPQAWRVPIGIAVTSAGSVTSVVNYALNGYYEAPLGTNLVGNTQVSLNHNLGTDCIATFRLRCNTAELNYSIGDIAFSVKNVSGAQPYTVSSDKLSTFFIIDAGTLYMNNKTGSGTVQAITLANWDYIPIVKRGW